MSSLLIISVDLGTEIFPSISLAYEAAESNIMKRGPRNVLTDRLVSFKLLFYSYVTVGAIEAAMATGGFLMVFWSYGFYPHQVAFTNKHYWGVNTTRNITNHFNVTYLPYEQLQIAHIASSVYYSTVVLCQFGHVWMCKTTLRSIFQHHCGNAVMNVGVMFELTLMCIIIFVPHVNTLFATHLFEPYWFVSGFIGICIIWTTQEIRKAILRRHMNGRLASVFLW